MSNRKRVNQVITQLEANRNNKKLSSFVKNILIEAFDIYSAFNIEQKVNPPEKSSRTTIYFLLFFTAGLMAGSLLITLSNMNL